MAKSIPASPFAADNGSAEPALVAALRAGDRYGAVNVFRSARVFVPVIAVLDSSEASEDGQLAEKDSHMATVSIQNPDGRIAMLAFSSVAALAAWSRQAKQEQAQPEQAKPNQARPVAARGVTVAAAALSDGADAVIVDADSANPLVIEVPALIAMIEGRDWVPPIHDADVRSAILTALTQLAETHGCQFELEQSTGPQDLRLVLITARTEDVTEILRQAGEVLASSELLRARLGGGIALTVSTKRGA